MSYPQQNNQLEHYGIPVAPRHAPDVEMTDSDHVNSTSTTTGGAHDRYVALGKSARREKLNKSRSPGKRVVYYHSLEPEQIWSLQQEQHKKGIGNIFYHSRMPDRALKLFCI